MRVDALVSLFVPTPTEIEPGPISVVLTPANQPVAFAPVSGSPDSQPTLIDSIPALSNV